ncbi:hypothetical protein D9611_001288 [Ephemerocybe angulata]|uniref:Uncharacterized protein n=1 Tax=Ephemerocybe angulata TaxID=980116 RepID=A0A8H5CKV0_9AGAR|nr:hypothetical protein D9611_001288 [Tulosesus angulatus]
MRRYHRRHRVLKNDDHHHRRAQSTMRVPLLLGALTLSSAHQTPFLTPTAPNPLLTPPSPNSTHALVFNTLSSLLSFWPNTRYRNGHTIVPGTIPAGTFLYHGTSTHAVPSTPEWTALDAEFSYIFCHAQRPGPPSDNGGCWHLTLLAVRELKVLYFDGASADKVFGALDAQDLIVYGEEYGWDGSDRDTVERVWDEPERLRRLCEWGEKYSLDGFVRMQSSFEVMLCNFTSPSLTPISFLNLVSGLQSPTSHNASLSQPDAPDQTTLIHLHRGLEAGTIHGSPRTGRTPETRVHLDWTRLLSFYDTSLFPSLVAGRARAEAKASTQHATDGSLTSVLHAWQHTHRGTHRVGVLGGISRTDRETLLTQLDALLSPPHAPGSGVPWPALYASLVDRYAERLELLWNLLVHPPLHSSPTEDTLSTLRNTHAYVDGMLTPYLLYTLHRPPPSNIPSALKSEHIWALPILHTCSSHTAPSHPALEKTYTPSEWLISQALNATGHEICRTLVLLWAIGVEVGLASPPSNETPTDADLTTLHEAYKTTLAALLTHLDWSLRWFKCTSPSPTSNEPESDPNPGDGCPYSETCYLPTWPLFHNLYPGLPGIPSRKWPPPNNGSPSVFFDNDEDEEHPDFSEWEYPAPRCIRRILPFDLP